MRANSSAHSSRWIYVLVSTLMVLSVVFGGAPQAAYGQAETPPPPPQVAPAGQGGELTAQCTPPDEPPAPKLVSPAIGSTLTTLTPLLDWQGNATYCPDYYNIQIWVDGGAMLLSAWPGASNFTVPTGKLTWGTKYNWYVWAHNIIHGFGDPLIASFSTTTVTNDDFGFLTAVSAPSYSIVESTLAATTASDDPTLPAACGTGKGSKSVWWSFTPNSKGTLDISTSGSDYDTLLAVWTGKRGALAPFPSGCNDNSPVDSTSVLASLPVKAGTTYYIEVVQAGGLDTGGSLHLAVVFHTAAVSTTYVSVGPYDGWVLETGDGTNKGGTYDSTSPTLIVGNTPNGRRYRSFLSFNAAGSPVPSGAVIISAVVSLKLSDISSPTPFDEYASLNVDIRKPYYGGTIKLGSADFQASSSLKSAGKISEPATPTSVYSAALLPAAFKYISRTSTTQFELRFPGDDIDNDMYDAIEFYSGDAATLAYRPVLVVTYYTP